MRPVMVTLNGDQRLERFEHLDRALEADCSWFDVVPSCRLRHHGTDKIVSQNVRPDLLPHQFGRLATQDVHLHRLLKGSQIKFRIPPGSIELREVAGSYRLSIQYR